MTLEEHRALGVTVRGDWGHFRRLDTTSVKQSYRVIPRTTVAGLLAGIVGSPRDSYYDVFTPDRSAIAVNVVNPVEVTRLSELELTTNENSMKAISGAPIRRIIKRQTTAEERQRNIYEWLKNPAYRIWVALDDDEFYEDLRTHLENGTTVYTPTIGKSECLATLDYHGEAKITATEAQKVDSVVPADDADITTAQNQISVERIPAYNNARDDGRGRELGGMTTVAYNADGKEVPVSNKENVYSVGTGSLNENVRFI